MQCQHNNQQSLKTLLLYEAGHVRQNQISDDGEEIVFVDLRLLNQHA